MHARPLYRILETAVAGSTWVAAISGGATGPRSGATSSPSRRPASRQLSTTPRFPSRSAVLSVARSARRRRSSAAGLHGEAHRSPSHAQRHVGISLRQRHRVAKERDLRTGGASPGYGAGESDASICVTFHSSAKGVSVRGCNLSAPPPGPPMGRQRADRDFELENRRGCETRTAAMATESSRASGSRRGCCT